MDSAAQIALDRSILGRIGVCYVNYETGETFGSSYLSGIGRGFGRDASSEDRMPDWLRAIHPADRSHVAQVVGEHFRNERQEIRCEYRVEDGDRPYRWLISSGVVERRDEDGRPIILLVHDQDVTGLHELRERLQAAQLLAENRANVAEALKTAGAVVLSKLDAPTAVEAVVEQLQTIASFDSAMVCELEDRQLRFIGGSREVTAENWKAFARKRLRRVHELLKSKVPETVEAPEDEYPHLLLVPLIWRGTVSGIFVLARSDHEFIGDEIRAAMTMGDYIAIALSNARMYQTMQMRAEIDHLSGVLTRQAFMELGEKEIDSSFHASKPVCCIMLDIDHFKSINDTYGHAVGDEVIRTLGSVLREGLRSTDIIGRFGGEEFCAVLTETEVNTGLDVAERLRRTIEETDFIGVDRRVTASIGLAGVYHTEPGQHATRLTIEQLINCADEALYNAKESGRNKVVEGNPANYDGSESNVAEASL